MGQYIVVLAGLLSAIVHCDPIPRLPHGPPGLPYENAYNRPYPFSPGPGPDPSTVKKSTTTTARPAIFSIASKPLQPSASFPDPTTTSPIAATGTQGISASADASNISSDDECEDPTITAGNSSAPTAKIASDGISAADTLAPKPTDPASPSNGTYGTSNPSGQLPTARRPSITNASANASSLGTASRIFSADPSSRPSSKSFNHTFLGTGTRGTAAPSASGTGIVIPSDPGISVSPPFPNNTIPSFVTGPVSGSGAATDPSAAATAASFSGSKLFPFPNNTLPLHPTASGSGLATASRLFPPAAGATVTSLSPSGKGFPFPNTTSSGPTGISDTPSASFITITETSLSFLTLPFLTLPLPSPNIDPATSVSATRTRNFHGYDPRTRTLTPVIRSVTLSPLSGGSFDPAVSGREESSTPIRITDPVTAFPGATTAAAEASTTSLSLIIDTFPPFPLPSNATDPVGTGTGTVVSASISSQGTGTGTGAAFPLGTGIVGEATATTVTASLGARTPVAVPEKSVSPYVEKDEKKKGYEGATRVFELFGLGRGRRA